MGDRNPVVDMWIHGQDVTTKEVPLLFDGGGQLTTSSMNEVEDEICTRLITTNT
ncbi:hypothetical protein [Pseudovibrio sp. Tun.PSC04-5.I4]|uniref:hypothetical protein n=1 Tax=Pseudovibrio sp. Tun.PSC04-5.I4 TaxID=1798213 RepID=UPI001AD8C70A|nr:hypothetical protein [Pseudovibrio sp. Tun.PSC04-5.I4]